MSPHLLIYHSVSADCLPQVVPRLGEKNSAGKILYRSIGDRKYAWFELRDFIEAFFRFHEAANEILIEPVTLFQKFKQKIFTPKMKASTIVPVNIETDSGVMSFYLGEHVDRRKKWSIEKYYDEAEKNRDDALRMLEETQKELDEPLPEGLLQLDNPDSMRQMRSGNQEDSDSGGSDDDSDLFVDKQYSNDS